MKTSLILAAFALSLALPAQTPVAAPAAKPLIDRAAIAQLEGVFEGLLSNPTSPDAFVLLGACSGLYLNGVGVVFITPLDLAVTPRITPFQPTISKAAIEALHKRKLTQLTLLRKTLKELLAKAAGTLTALPPNEKLVVAARLQYMEWEDHTGLPNQVVVSADRASALSGNVQLDEQ